MLDFVEARKSAGNFSQILLISLVKQDEKPYSRADRSCCLDKDGSLSFLRHLCFLFGVGFGVVVALVILSLAFVAVVAAISVHGLQEPCVALRDSTIEETTLETREFVIFMSCCCGNLYPRAGVRSSFILPQLPCSQFCGWLVHRSSTGLTPRLDRVHQRRSDHWRSRLPRGRLLSLSGKN